MSMQLIFYRDHMSQIFIYVVYFIFFLEWNSNLLFLWNKIEPKWMTVYAFYDVIIVVPFLAILSVNIVYRLFCRIQISWGPFDRSSLRANIVCFTIGNLRTDSLKIESVEEIFSCSDLREQSRATCKLDISSQNRIWTGDIYTFYHCEWFA